MVFQVAVNTKYQDKVKPGDGRFWDFNMTFQNETLTLTQLLAHIQQGHAWTAPHEHVRRHRPTRRNPNYYTTYRVKENVSGSQLLALDSDTEDERSSFDGLLDDMFISRYAGLLHASASSTPQRPRTRVVFVLDRPLDRDAYEMALKALLGRYAFCDQSVNHAGVVFYGAKDCDYLLGQAVLPVAVLQAEIIAPYQARLAAAKRAREVDRQRRLQARGAAAEGHPDQVYRYVEQARQNILSELAATAPGQGLRHQLLFMGAVKLGALRAAGWLTAPARELLRGIEDDLLDAAYRNGYLRDYGEDDVLRTIENGISIGLTNDFEEPVWYEWQAFLDVGDLVEVVVKGKVIARGRVRRFRENRHWEYELDTRPNVWFARTLLK